MRRACQSIPSDEELTMTMNPLISGVRVLSRDFQHAAPAPVDADPKLALVRVDFPLAGKAGYTCSRLLV